MQQCRLRWQVLHNEKVDCEASAALQQASQPVLAHAKGAAAGTLSLLHSSAHNQQ